MQFKKWLFTSIGLIFLYLTFWSILRTSGILMNHPNDDLSQFLPEKTDYAVRIYSNNIIKTFYQELFFYKEDGAIQDKIQNYIVKTISKTDSTPIQTTIIMDKLQGIDFFNDIIFFQFTENQVVYSGLLCHVNDSAAFINTDRKNKDYLKLCDKSIGVIIQTEKGKHQSNALGKLALKLLSSKKSKKLRQRRNSTIALADVYYSIKDKKQKLSELTMEINADAQKISFSGKLVPEFFEVEHNPGYLLQAKNLNICIRDIPESIQSEIQKWLAQNKIPNIGLEEIQINYEGLDIEFTPTYLAIKPNFEAIIKTNGKKPIKEYLANPIILNTIGGKLDSNFVAINNVSYFFEQLDSCTFYIGNNAKPIYEKRLNTDPILIRGKLSHLTNIQTGGMDFLLNIVPLYASINNYFLNQERFNFRITQDATQNIFEGDIEFKEGNNAFFESLFLITELQEMNTLLK